jgi:HPt (histidine-containing phosphotransfer) domain-containing protein
MESTTAAPRLFDRKAALHRLDGDVELFEMLVGVFLQDSVQLLNELEEAAANGDLKTVERSAHSLKGLAANFDAVQARDAAFVLEQAARGTKDAGRLAPAIQDLQVHFVQLREALQRPGLN